MEGDDVGALQGVQLSMPVAACVVTETGMLASMQQGEVIEDMEEHMLVWFPRDKVIVDVREFTRGPEVFCQVDGRVIGLWHRQGRR